MNFNAIICFVLFICFTVHDTSGLTFDQSNEALSSEQPLELNNNHLLGVLYQLRVQINNVFEKINSLDTKMKSLENKIEDLHTTARNTGEKILNIEPILVSMDAKIANNAKNVETEMKNMESKIQTIDTNVEIMKPMVESIDTEIVGILNETVFGGKLRFCVEGANDVPAEIFIPHGRSICNKTLSTRSRDLQNSIDFVPILKINGTKLYTGLYYRVGMKVFPQGWITWVEKGKYYIEVELTPSELPKYEPGRDFQFDNQWYFGPTESPIGYTMTNRGKSNGCLIWASAKVGSGHHVAVYDGPEARSKMSPGGAWRNDALWIPQGTNEENYWNVENLAKRNNFLTWTLTKHNEFNYYIQMANYMEDDSKFSFAPSSNIKLEARVFDLKFDQLLELDDILELEETYETKLVAKRRLPNRSGSQMISNLKESIEMKDQFTISLTESWTMMDKTTVSLDFLKACDSQRQEFSFKGGFEANQEKSTEIKHTVTLKKKIKIPPYTDIEASIHSVLVQNIEIPFTAKMEINGLAGRILVSRPGEVKEDYIPVEVVEEIINSSGRRNMEIISRSNENLIVSVSGTIKGNFGLKGVLSTSKVGDLRNHCLI